MLLFAHNNWTKLLRELLSPFYSSTDKLSSLPSFRTSRLAKKLSANCCISESSTFSANAIMSKINTLLQRESCIMETLCKKNIVKWHGGENNFKTSQEEITFLLLKPVQTLCHTYQLITFNCAPKLKFALWPRRPEANLTKGETTWDETELLGARRPGMKLNFWGRDNLRRVWSEARRPETKLTLGARWPEAILTWDRNRNQKRNWPGGGGGRRPRADMTWGLLKS